MKTFACMLFSTLLALLLICVAFSHNGLLQEVAGRVCRLSLSRVFRIRNYGSHDQSVALASNSSTHRKLLDPERMGDACTSADIAILQGETGPLPDGIPSFTVQIINLCVAGCPVSDIHVSCGWFASAKLINPKIFKRVKFNDCIVNDKLPLKGGDSIVFEYANSYQYPLQISSVNACCL